MSRAATGRELYVEHCATCHGKTGAGDGPGALVIRTGMPDLTDEARMRETAPSWMQRTIWDGEGAMPSWSGTLSRQASWDLTFYLWSRSLAPGPSDEAAFARHCSACHGSTPRKDAEGAGPRLDARDRAAGSFADEGRWLRGMGSTDGLRTAPEPHPALTGVDEATLDAALRHAWTYLYEPIRAPTP